MQLDLSIRHVNGVNFYLGRRSLTEKKTKQTNKKKLYAFSYSFCSSAGVLNICEAENLPLIIQDEECVYKAHCLDGDPSSPFSTLVGVPDHD